MKDSKRDYPAPRGRIHVDDIFSDRKDTSNHHIGKPPLAHADAGLGEAPPLRVAGHTDAARADL